jgi:hypothetical protein
LKGVACHDLDKLNKRNLKMCKAATEETSGCVLSGGNHRELQMLLLAPDAENNHYQREAVLTDPIKGNRHLQGIAASTEPFPR